MHHLIFDFLNRFEINDIEKGLVVFFVKKNNIKVTNNQFILSILTAPTNNNVLEINRLLNANYFGAQFSIFELEKCFELLIPTEDRKINGAFFTPQFITNFIAAQTIKTKKDKICDPSCGCGAFLIAAIDTIRNQSNTKIIDIIEKNLFGVDILDYSTYRCKIILTLYALLHGEDQKEIVFKIYTKDSLKIDWQKDFGKAIPTDGFDAIIGNPPYVKYQDLAENTRKELFRDWSTLKTGTYNLYFAFFELGVSLLKKTGRLGYITPNNYFTSLAGIHLREFFHFNKFMEKIIDFNHLRIFDAQTYTCITFLTKAKKDYFLFERIDTQDRLQNLDKINFSKTTYNNLDDKKWRLLKDDDKENIIKIETAGPKLGSLVDIRVGIATCKDNIYFVDGATLNDGYYQKEFDDRVFPIEKEITRPIVKISDFNTQNDLKKNGRKIIFPYFIKNGKAYLMPKNQLQEKFPKCYEYFVATKDILESRDKGKSTYSEWYAYARSQGLNIFGEKLLTPTFSRSPRFLYEKRADSLFCNGYGIFAKKDSASLFNDSISLEILSKILNSRIMAYYINQTSVSIEGGYPCYQKNFIERFTIPNFAKNELGCLNEMFEPKEIENFLTKKYGVNLPE
ncbi:MAG: N-6 DNA methylase [Candidatus Omnitrophota bacterium]